MSSSAFESEDSGEQYQPDQDAQGPESSDSPDTAPDSGLLEEVLQETLAGIPEEAVTPAELDALLDVVRRYKGLKLSVEPIATDLVQSLLQIRFTTLKLTPPSWREMATQIAQSLMDDDNACRRLETFWKRLAEAAP